MLQKLKNLNRKLNSILKEFVAIPILLGLALLFALLANSIVIKNDVDRTNVEHIRSTYSKYLVGIFVENKEDPKKSGFGTGFLFKTKNSVYILTNKHVCSGASEVVIVKPGVKAIIKRRVLDTDLIADICVIEPLPGQTIGLQIDDKPARGTTIAQIGFTGANPLSIYVGEFLGEVQKYVNDAVPPDQLNAMGVNPEQLCQQPNYLTYTEKVDFMGNRFKYFKCTFPQNLSITSTSNAPGGSGSPIINLQTGKIISIASMIFGNLSQTHGCAYDDMTKFLQLY